MKRIIFAFAFITTSLSTIAGNDGVGDKYCAKVKDGKTVVTTQGNIITSDVTLDDGTIVKPDGVLIMKDGSKMTLNDGQCINRDGSTTVNTNKPK